ncbi:MAG: alternative ribosome rescue aminoacyl-tRNA hydrolase ArfB [Anaerolineales bacterium]|jgi:ribosome-associated protein|nr:alternative ribosome rescue aminoacyl-tRNA hydrolase ArfB [Anaerolineales bacterium]
MLEINSTLSIPDEEIKIEFIRASGPGGQNVNKVATAAQLRFDAAHSPSLSAEVKERLLQLAGARATNEGLIIIEAKKYRTQEQNRADAVLRLQEIIQQALKRPKIRRPTRPGRAASAARVSAKKQRGALKKIRQYNPQEWE